MVSSVRLRTALPARSVRGVSGLGTLFNLRPDDEMSGSAIRIPLSVTLGCEAAKMTFPESL